MVATGGTGAGALGAEVPAGDSAFASIAFTAPPADVPPGTLTLSNMGLAMQALASARRAKESFLVEELTDAEIDAMDKKGLEDVLTKAMLTKMGSKAHLQDILRRCRDATKKLKAEADAVRAAARQVASGGGRAAGTSGAGGGVGGGADASGKEEGGGGVRARLTLAGDDTDAPGSVDGTTRARGIGNVPVRGVLQPLDANVQPPRARSSAATSTSGSLRAWHNPRVRDRLISDRARRNTAPRGVAVDGIHGSHARFPVLDGGDIRGRDPVCRQTPAGGHTRASPESAARVGNRLRTFATTRGAANELEGISRGGYHRGHRHEILLMIAEDTRLERATRPRRDEETRVRLSSPERSV